VSGKTQAAGTPSRSLVFPSRLTASDRHQRLRARRFMLPDARRKLIASPCASLYVIFVQAARSHKEMASSALAHRRQAAASRAVICSIYARYYSLAPLIKRYRVHRVPSSVELICGPRLHRLLDSRAVYPSNLQSSVQQRHVCIQWDSCGPSLLPVHC